MKELERRLNNLTSEPQTPYSKGGDIFMAGEAQGENMPQNPQSRGPEQSESAQAKNTISPEEKQRIDKAWQKHNAQRVSKGEKISVGELRSQEMVKEKGFMPPLTQEAKDLLEKIAGGGVPTTVTNNFTRILKENGIPDEDITNKKPEELINMLRANRFSEQKNEPQEQQAATGGAGGRGGVPPAPPVAGSSPEPERENNEGQGEADAEQQREPADQPRPIDASEITDRDALNLIRKFNQEIGYLDRGKIDQLKRDLSERINNLTTQRLSQSVDTEAGSREIERLEAEITRLRGVFPDLDEMLLARRQGGERMSEEERALFDRTTKFLQDLQNANLNPDDIANLTSEQKVARTSIAEDIEKFIKESNPVETGGFPSEILRIARYFNELREGLISELIFKSYEDPSETGEYEMDLYASSNLNTLLGFLSRDDPARYRYFFSLKTAAHYFHAMNAGILTGNFERFGRIAETINYQHFKNMEEIRGIGPIMRLYEQKYKYYLGKDKRITEEGYTALKIDIEKTFRDMNKKGLVRSEYEQYRQSIGDKNVEHDENPWEMKEWEINRALGAGRAFFNITLRGAENIATGQMPEDRKQFASFPQEDMVRVLNWNEWFLRRFRFGVKRHGVEFLGMVTNKNQEFMKYTGEKLDPEKDDRANRIIEFGGVNTRKMENGGQYHTSGVYSGWRMENLAFDGIYFNFNDDRISVMNFMDNVIKIDKKGDTAKPITDRIKERLKKNPNMDPADAVTLEDQRQYRDLFMPLVSNLDIGLSMLIKNGKIGGTKKLGYLLREEIWKKIASKNTSLMIDYLTNIEIKYAAGTPEDIKVKDINTLRGERTQPIIGPQWVTDKEWNTFREKVLLRHERMMKEAMGEGNQLQPLSSEEEYTPDEQELIKRITEEGGKLAPHLADIVFPYMPFMNDIPFEKLDYSGPGQTFYKRRTGGDLNGFNKGQQAFMKIMSNPGGIEIKDAMEAMHEIIEGVSSPEGDEFGMESNFATLESLLDVTMAKKGSRNAFLKAIKEFTRNPTSRAQEWSGIKAASIIEGEVSNLLDTAVQKGLLSPELSRYMKRKKNATLIFILWMLLRDVVMLSPAILATEFGSELMKSGK